MPSIFAGSRLPAIELATVGIVIQESAMSMFVDRVIPFTSASSLGAAHLSLAVLPDGSTSTPLWYEHDSGKWSTPFEEAKHVKRLARMTAPESCRNLQTLVVAGEVADDPAVGTVVFTLRDDGTAIDVAAALSHAAVASETRTRYFQV